MHSPRSRHARTSFAWLCAASLWFGCRVQQATEDGTLVFDWHAGLDASGQTVLAPVRSSWGNGYQVEAVFGEHAGKWMPKTVRVTLVHNATGAQVSGHCVAPQQLAAQPNAVWSSHCTLQESSSEVGFFRTTSRQNRQTLRVHGDGRIELEPSP